MSAEKNHLFNYQKAKRTDIQSIDGKKRRIMNIKTYQSALDLIESIYIFLNTQTLVQNRRLVSGL